MDSFGHEGMPKTLVVDSITELQRSEVMRHAGNKEGRFTTQVISPEIKDWGNLLNELTLLANLFYSLECHVVFSGLEAVDYGKTGIGEPPVVQGYRVALQGAAKRQFPAYAMSVIRLDRAPRSSQGIYNVGYTDSVLAKTKEQTGFLPKQIPNPTIPQLVEFLTAEL